MPDGPPIPPSPIDLLIERCLKGDQDAWGEIVRLHGGKAWAERIPGGGTAFRFTLPVERSPDMPVEAAATCA